MSKFFWFVWYLAVFSMAAMFIEIPLDIAKGNWLGAAIDVGLMWWNGRIANNVAHTYRHVFNDEGP